MDKLNTLELDALKLIVGGVKTVAMTANVDVTRPSVAVNATLARPMSPSSQTASAHLAELMARLG